VPRQRPVVHRMTLAGSLAAAIAGTAVVVSLTFAGNSAAAENGAGTNRVSVSTGGVQGALDSSEPAISADGRYVAFATDEPFDPVDKLAASQSIANGHDPEKAADADVYVRDTRTGTTTLVSSAVDVLSDGRREKKPGDGDSDQPSISGDGRYIAFRTTSQNIASDPDAAAGIVVCDRDPDGDGTLDDACRYTKISFTKEYAPGNPRISADGLRISYDVAPVVPISIMAAPARPALTLPNAEQGWVDVVNLHHGAHGNLDDVKDDDRTFATAPPTLDVGGATHTLSWQGDSAMAAGGTHVAFVAHYLAPSPADATADAVFEYDVSATTVVRLDVDGIAADGRGFGEPAFSGDGRRYAFTDTQRGRVSVRLYDRDPDGDGRFGTPDTEVASRTPDGTAGLGAQPAFSADGRYLAFTTPTPGMHNGTDAGGRSSSCLGRGAGLSYCDIVVRDLVVDRDRAAKSLPRLPAVLASPSANCAANPQPCEGTGDSGRPSATGDGSKKLTGDGGAALSADGSALAFASAAADLIGGGADSNAHLDVFRRRFAPALSGDPQDFGAVPLGSEAVRDVPLTDVGEGPLTVGAVTVAGADFDVFPGETCTTLVLHATEKCTVSVRFAPTALGVRTATLQVTINGVPTPLTVPLTGTGVAAPTPAFAAGPGTLDFGARPVLQTSPGKSVTVRNTGTGPLQLGAVTLGAGTATTFPGDYKLTAGGCANRAIAPGAACRIDVRHRPAAVGARPAVLTIAYTGPTGPLTFPVSLTGAGVAPTLKSSPTVTPAGRVIQVSGTGFPPGSTAKLSLVGMPGTTTAKAGADGTFRVPFVVLPNTWTGHHPLNADVLPATAPGLSGPLRATLEFVIVPGSPVPPNFDIRN
jgi:Tol biopolymer transport system component